MWPLRARPFIIAGAQRSLFRDGARSVKFAERQSTFNGNRGNLHAERQVPNGQPNLLYMVRCFERIARAARISTASTSCLSRPPCINSGCSSGRGAPDRPMAGAEWIAATIRPFIIAGAQRSLFRDGARSVKFAERQSTFNGNRGNLHAERQVPNGQPNLLYMVRCFERIARAARISTASTSCLSRPPCINSGCSSGWGSGSTNGRG
jgi:hypothetical protein